MATYACVRCLHQLRAKTSVQKHFFSISSELRERMPAMQHTRLSVETASTDLPKTTSRIVGKTIGETNSLLDTPPDQPKDANILRVAIIGSPNTGKSTLTNELVGWRVCAVSEKINTTRRRTLGVLTQGRVQVVFLDTPGMISNNFSLKLKQWPNWSDSLYLDPYNSLETADVIAVMVDTSNYLVNKGLQQNVLQGLHLYPDKHSILILNKVDKVKRKDLLLSVTRKLTGGFVRGKRTPNQTKKTRLKANEVDISKYLSEKPAQETTSSNGHPSETDSVATCGQDHDRPNSKRIDDSDTLSKRLRSIEIDEGRGWTRFQEVFMISALTGDGVAEVRDYLLKAAKPGDWMYHSSLVTNQDPIEVAKLCLWEKLLDHVPKDIPYRIIVDVVMLDMVNGVLSCVVELDCKQDNRLLKHALGLHGDKIKTIAREAKQAMMDTFRCEMTLKVYVK